MAQRMPSGWGGCHMGLSSRWLEFESFVPVFELWVRLETPEGVGDPALAKLLCLPSCC